MIKKKKKDWVLILVNHPSTKFFVVNFYPLLWTYWILLAKLSSTNSSFFKFSKFLKCTLFTWLYIYIVQLLKKKKPFNSDDCICAAIHLAWWATKRAAPWPSGVLHSAYATLQGPQCHPRCPRLHVLLHRTLRRVWPLDKLAQQAKLDNISLTYWCLFCNHCSV